MYVVWGRVTGGGANEFDRDWVSMGSAENTTAV